MKHALSVVLVLCLAACGGLHTVKVQPVTVEPIHMTIDVNLHDGSDAPAQR
jgi:hypothetical protein